MLGTIRSVVTEGAVLFPSATILSVPTQDQGFRALVVHPELWGSTWKLFILSLYYNSDLGSARSKS